MVSNSTDRRVKGGRNPLRERSVETRLCRGVNQAGGLCLKFVSPGCTGVPDRIVLLPGGRIVFVELKQPKGRVSRRQEYVIRLLRALGFDARYIWSVEEVDAFVEEVKKGEV